MDIISDSGRIKGLLVRVKGHMGVKIKFVIVGYRIGPPADRL
jgi:hypothetical protein